MIYDRSPYREVHLERGRPSEHRGRLAIRKQSEYIAARYHSSWILKVCSLYFLDPLSKPLALSQEAPQGIARPAPG